MSFQGAENIVKLLTMMVSQLYKHTSNHLIVRFTWLNFMAGKVDLKNRW